ncbi:Rossmann-fold NAD(P)-binding domain-containing protein [Peribacillus butanolivorans]|uniref:hypothetical protein n=1 Tax=Peribacillus butanolivorans TaxID=421767 RepID=UPI0006A73DEF|nr:hypothetical protein [Peribacillus butanolivorans]
MTNDKAVGTITAEEKVDHPHKSIPRADVATVLAHSVTFNKTFEISSGNLPIKEAPQYIKYRLINKH